MIEVKKSRAQMIKVAHLNVLERDIKNLTEQRNLLISCGLDKEARKLGEKLSKALEEHDKVAEEIIAERIDLCRILRKVIVACDLAYAYTGEFRDAIIKSAGRDHAMPFVQSIQKLENAAKNIVAMLDEATENGPAAISYADFESEFEDRIEQIVGKELESAVNEYVKSKDFAKYYG